MTSNPTAAQSTANDLAITRVFDAPRALVWRAWTEPEHLVKWCGPRDYPSPACRVDLRVGGKYAYCMRSPEGRDLWNGGTYLEVVPLERLVCRDSFLDAAGNVVPASYYEGMPASLPMEWLVTVTFEEHDGKTTLTIHTTAYSDPEVVAMATAGWNQSLDKLAESLGLGREVVISRVFDAPRELVFNAYADPAHVGNWWGPSGFTTTTHEIDVRPGGVWRFIMHGPDGTDYPNRIVYDEILPPERLVLTHSDDAEDAQVHFQAFITFEALGAQTRITMRSVFPTAEAREHVVRKFGAIEGGIQHLDRLGEYLAAM